MNRLRRAWNQMLCERFLGHDWERVNPTPVYLRKRPGYVLDVCARCGYRSVYWSAHRED